MSAPRLLELFAGEGGAAYGYKLAGFDVTAVDDQVRPGRAPGITWVTGDATTYPLDGFDVVTGGPPCTDHTTLANVAEAVRGGSTGTGLDARAHPRAVRRALLEDGSAVGGRERRGCKSGHAEPDQAVRVDVRAHR